MRKNVAKNFAMNFNIKQYTSLNIHKYCSTFTEGCLKEMLTFQIFKHNVDRIAKASIEIDLRRDAEALIEFFVIN